MSSRPLALRDMTSAGRTPNPVSRSSLGSTAGARAITAPTPRASSISQARTGMTPSLARSSLATSRATAITSANRSSIAASRAATLQSGFSNGVFVNTHDHAFVHDNVFVVGHGHHHYHDYHHHHHHHGYYPYYAFGFGIGFGFGYGYGSYYYGYPYYGWPYYGYPYYGWYGYPSPVYYYPPPYYDGYYPDRNYVYHDTPPSGTSPASAPAAETVPPPAAQPEDDITPIPPEEMLDRASADGDRSDSDRSDSVPSVKMEIAERTALNGLAEFRSGSYNEAADTLFSAVQADPSSPTLKVYLAEALYAMGEYKFSAEYLRQALEARPDLIQKNFTLGRLYAPSPQGEQDLAEHYEQLSAWSALRPYDTDALLVLGFVQLQSGRLAEAGTTAIALRNGSPSPIDRTFAERLFAESEVRSGTRPEASPQLSPEPSDDDDRLARALVASLDS